MDTETENKKEKRKKQKKKKSLGRIILMIIGFVLLFAVTVALTIGFLTIRPPDVSGKNTNSDKTTQVEERTDGRYSVLVVGTDDAGLNTDTILVASLDSKHNTASVMSIPRDTMSNVTRNVKKINAAYAAGAKDGVGNIDNLKKEISYLVGFPVDNYVVIDLTAFEELIDALGGVTIDVPRNMHYDDPYQDLHIHIDKGLQTLNGKDAIGFVRFRSDYAEGDLGRVKAQQMFIEALAKQVATPATVTKLPQLTDIVLDNMRTDLTYGELVWFVKEAVSVDMSTNLHMFTLPGIAETVKPNGSYQALSYYLPYEDEILEIVNAYFNPYSKDLVDLNVVDTEALLAQAGKQRAEREQQKEETENAEGAEDESNAGALDENGNPIEKNDNASVNEENHADNDTSNREEGSTDISIDENNGDTSAIEPEQNPDNTTEPTNPNTQAPDEVLKSEAEQEFNPVEEPEDITDAGAQLPETPEGSAEQPPVTEESVQSGGIPGEVLKSDVE